MAEVKPLPRLSYPYQHSSVERLANEDADSFSRTGTRVSQEVPLAQKWKEKDETGGGIGKKGKGSRETP
jgi:hypothetical protein